MTMTMMKMVVTVMVEVMMVAVMVMTKNDNDDLYDVDDNGLNLCLSLIYFPSAEGRLQMILIIC